MSRFTRFDWRALGGISLLVIGRIGLLVVLVNVLAHLLFGAELLTLRAGAMALTSVALLLVASAVFSDWSIALQTVLHTLAIASLIVGAGAIVTMAFRDWRVLGTLFTVKALLAVGLGFATAYALKRFQENQNRHRKSPNNRMQRARDA